MTDDADVPRDVDAEFDPQAQAWVADALSRLDFLRPDADLSDTPMPDEVWARLQSALATEVAASTVPLAVGADRRGGRALRWTGGLVAASVAVLAVGGGVLVFRDSGSSGGTVVAGEVVAASAATEADAAATAENAPDTAARAPAAKSADPLDPQVLEQPQQLSFAGMVPPALRLVDTKTEYTDTGLGDQVAEVMDQIGLSPEQTEPAELAAAPEWMPMPATEPVGFWSTAESLRDCITKLTEQAKSTALLVDLSTYEGQAAGVVVAPEYSADEPDMSRLEVWVVDPSCDHALKAIQLDVVRQ